MTMTNGPRAEDQGRRPTPWAQAQETEVLELIRRADKHELGRDFLTQGALDSVAATFGVHAFLIDAARERLAQA